MLKYQTFLEKLAGRIGTLRGPVLARGPEFVDRCTRKMYNRQLSKKKLYSMDWTLYLRCA